MYSFELPPCRRLLLLGGGHLLAHLAQWARNEGHSVQVITSPRHAEETLHLEEGNLIERLEIDEIPVCVTRSIDTEEVRSIIGDPDDTFCLSIGAPWIFSDVFLDRVFRGRLFNLHGTRLPLYRGGGGFSWQIMNGNRLGFCALHKIEAGIDTGDLLAIKEFLYPSSCRIPLDYIKVYEEENVVFLTEIMADAFRDGAFFSLVSQPEYLSTYWPRLHTPTHGWIDWSLSASEIEQFICAFDKPYEGAQTFWNNQPVHLRTAMADFNEGSFHPFQAGLVFRNNGRWLNVATYNGTVIVETIANNGGRDILQEIRPGDRLHTPDEKLAAALQRVTFTPQGLK